MREPVEPALRGQTRRQSTDALDHQAVLPLEVCPAGGQCLLGRHATDRKRLGVGAEPRIRMEPQDEREHRAARKEAKQRVPPLHDLQQRRARRLRLVVPPAIVSVRGQRHRRVLAVREQGLGVLCPEPRLLCADWRARRGSGQGSSTQRVGSRRVLAWHTQARVAVADARTSEGAKSSAADELSRISRSELRPLRALAAASSAC